MQQDKYLITIDRNLIHEYHLEYLKKNPKARTLPFAKPKSVKQFNNDGSPKLTSGGNPKTKKQAVNKKNYTIDDCLYGTMSLNELLVINDRITMNHIKEIWGNLGIWIAEKYNLCDLNIINSIVEYRIFSETQAQKDCDNIAAGIKVLNDGLFVKSKMFEDDNYNHINPLVIVGDYDKHHPRTEIRITTFDENIKDVYEKMELHIRSFR